MPGVRQFGSRSYSSKFNKPRTTRFHMTAGLRSLIMAKRFSRIPKQPAYLRSFRGEIKALDVPVQGYNINTSGSITCMNLIRIGSTFVNRIGRRVEMKNLRLTGILTPLRTNASEDYMRIMIVYDRQPNGAFPALADIIQTTDQAAANTTGVFSNINLNNRDRFIFLRDKRIALPSLTVTAGVVTNPGFIDPITTLTNFDFFVKLKGLVAQYKADSAPAVIGDIATGALLLVIVGGTASGSEGYQCSLESRLRFNDH